MRLKSGRTSVRPYVQGFDMMRYFSALSPCLLLTLIFLSSASAAQSGNPAIEANLSQLSLPAGVRPVEFASGKVNIQSATGRHTLQVEIAETRRQIERGMMYRTSLPETDGMLFIYPKANRGSFWMLNTFIPLSIAYADELGVIFQISDMTPCGNLPESECAKKTYPAREPFRFALEVNQGYFARRGISVGDRIEVMAD
jgi:uncharacterized protein